jgi:hypothetical protein
MAIGSETLSAENRSINSVFKAACGTQIVGMMLFAMNSKFLFWAATDRVLVHMEDFAVSDAYSSEPCNKEPLAPNAA